MKKKFNSSASFSNRKEAEKYVKELKTELEAVNAKVEALKAKLGFEEIDSTIWHLERAHFVGDYVHWEETCRRGCCIEDSFVGHITDIKPGKYSMEYTLKNPQTGNSKTVSGGDFRRI